MENMAANGLKYRWNGRKNLPDQCRVARLGEHELVLTRSYTWATMMVTGSTGGALVGVWCGAKQNISDWFERQRERRARVHAPHAGGTQRPRSLPGRRSASCTKCMQQRGPHCKKEHASQPIHPFSLQTKLRQPDNSLLPFRFVRYLRLTEGIVSPKATC